MKRTGVQSSEAQLTARIEAALKHPNVPIIMLGEEAHQFARFLASRLYHKQTGRGKAAK